VLAPPELVPSPLQALRESSSKSSVRIVPFPREPVAECLVRWLFAPIDIAAIVYYRVAFGALALWQVWRFADAGWTDHSYIEPDFHFSYYEPLAPPLDAMDQWWKCEPASFA
jgi:hypothetical protein